jgi:hypothetical protein
MEVKRLSDLEGRWISPSTKILTKPKVENGRWTALAIVEDMLCVVELKIS